MPHKLSFPHQFFTIPTTFIDLLDFFVRHTKTNVSLLPMAKYAALNQYEIENKCILKIECPLNCEIIILQDHFYLSQFAINTIHFL